MSNAMKMNTILFIILLACIGHSEELPIYFDPGIDSYIFNSRASTETLLRSNTPNISFGFSTYEFKLGDRHIIQFIAHPGGVKFEASGINIIEDLNSHLPILYPGTAITQKGIYLGMSKKELISKLGQPKVALNDTLEYKVENDAGILSKYNMSIYCGKYIFRQNKLVSFSFGFGYP